MTFTPPRVGPNWFSDSFYAALSAGIRFLESLYTVLDLIFTPRAWDDPLDE